MPDLPFKPDTKSELLLAMVLDRLDALLAATALPFSATDKVHIVFYGEAG